MRTIFENPTYQMKTATNKLEAIDSILDVMTENPLWLLKCTSKEFVVVYRLHKTDSREQWLNAMSFKDVKKLYQEIYVQYDKAVPTNLIF